MSDLAWSSLEDAKIVLLGLGPINTCILDILLHTGVGTFICIDFRSVEVEILQGQTVYASKDIGQPRTAVLEKYVERTAPKTSFHKIDERIVNATQLEHLIVTSHFLVCTSDDPPFRIREWVTTACLSANIPYLCVADGVIGPLCVPFQTACYGCYLCDLEEKFDQLAAFATARADNRASIFHSSKAQNWFAPTISATSMILGSVTAIEIIKYFTKTASLETYDHVIRGYNQAGHPTMFLLENVPRRADCPFCSFKHS